MAKALMYEKFPCGYERHIEVSVFSIWTFLFGWIDETERKDNICPLHGKKCKK